MTRTVLRAFRPRPPQLARVPVLLGSTTTAQKCFAPCAGMMRWTCGPQQSKSTLRCSICFHAAHSRVAAARSLYTERAVRCRVAPPAEFSELSAPSTSVIELDVPAEGFDSIPDALQALAAGEIVVVLDDANRENEGDLIIAADRVTPEKIAFIVDNTSGVLCVGMQGADCDRLRLPLMVPSLENEESMYTAFTVTVDLRHGISTGISASDRAATIAALGRPDTTHEDLRKPGHIFPLRGREGGVLVRAGHTEAAIDLAYYAGCYPAGVLCEVVDKRTGDMARTAYLQAFAREHGLKCVTIADLVRYRLKREVLLRQTAGVALATRWGDFRAVGFQSLLEQQEHLALLHGDVKQGRPLVRIHEESVIADVFGVENCDSQPALDKAMRAIVAHGSGILIYLARRSITQSRILSSLRHVAEVQESCTVAADSAPVATLDIRDMGNINSVLQGVRASASVSLITDNDSDVENLRAFGHDVDMLRLSTLL